MRYRMLTKSLLLLLVTTSFALAPSDSKSESHRIKRVIKKNPGFFRTLFSVAYEQWVDTKNTIQSVNKMINDNFLPENGPLIETTTVSSDPNVTTTAAPFRITRTEFNRILNRNLKGLVRLFNIELQDALRTSEGNYAQYKKNASVEVSKFL